MIGSFFRENREFIKGAVGVLMMIAGLVLIILSHVLPGLLVLFAGLLLFMRTLSGVLNSSGYAGEDSAFHGLKGLGRSASVKNSNTKTVSSETTSAIWDQMKGDDNKE
ncbi:MAG: hypothetical protein IKM11_01020 [Oscillospiraceae bacterium]|nr:hypothetical protein [Oscillospiraceae bacterium]